MEYAVMVLEGDFDVKLSISGTARKFRLLRQRGSKAWVVREIPPRPQVEQGVAAREGMPPERALPFIQEDFAWGVGLENFTQETSKPGHVLRYADGYGIDTSDVRISKHGPALLADVGTLDETPLMTLLWRDEVWFLTPTYLYSWDGATLTKEWTNPDGVVNQHMEVHSGRIYIAGGSKYYHSADGSSFTTNVTPADRFLSIGGNQLWRSYNDDFLTNSSDPEVGSPTWGSAISCDDTISNLFSVSGIVGVTTTATLYLVDTDRNLVELNKALRQRRSSTAFSLKAESGSDVWFSDGTDILRLVAQGFETFDIRPGGPFYGYDDRPVDSPPAGTATIKDITQDLTAMYVACTRSDDSDAFYIYKGVEIVRGLFAWSPLLRYVPSGAITFCEVLKMSGDAAPIVYFNDGTTVKRFSTQWTTYAATWELHTPYFTATLENWDKMAHNLRATIEWETNSKVAVHYQKDTDTSWTEWGGTAPANEMATNGSNEIALTTPIDNKKIRLRFVGTTSNSANKVNLRSFHLESILRPDSKRTFEFSVVADNKGDTDFIYTLRTTLDAFMVITDRFGTDYNAFLLPGFPIELELVDEVLKEPVRVYQMQAQEV
jgi:hypothetical protein